MLRHADAILEVQKLNMFHSKKEITSNMTAILTTFVAASPDSPERKAASKESDFGNQIGLKEVTDAVGSKAETAVEFLLAGFMRCLKEGSKSLPDMTKQIVVACEKAIIKTFVIVCKDQLWNLEQNYSRVTFYRRLMEDTISQAFLIALLEDLSDPEEYDEKSIAGVFGQIFDLLRTTVMAQHFEENKDQNVRRALQLVSMLLNLKVHGYRPLCKHVVHRYDFHPSPTEILRGREFGVTSFLGTFLDYGLVSSGRRPNTRVFVDSELDALNNDGTVNIEQKQYATRIGSLRPLMHAIFLPLVSDAYCRKFTLKWMSTLLISNESRGQQHFDPAAVVDDHIMTNFLWVLFKLSAKIDMAKICPTYPFQPGSLVNIGKQTRINMDEMSSTEFALTFC